MCDEMAEFEDDMITDEQMRAIDDRLELALVGWQMEHFGSAIPNSRESLQEHLRKHDVHLAYCVPVEEDDSTP